LPSAQLASLRDPAVASCDHPIGILITGIGGSGVVTIGAVLGMAAHLDGLAVSAFDMTGLAQKGGAVLSHVKIARNPAAITTPRIGLLAADLVLGCDLVVTAGAEVQRAIAPGHTQVVLNTHLVPTAGFQRNPDVDFHTPELRAKVEALATSACVQSIDAAEVARAQLGDTIGTNMMMVGFALQCGLLPLSLAAIRQAITLNGTAVDFNLRALDLGRRLALPADQRGVETTPAPAPGVEESLDSIVEFRVRLLTVYQDAAYASRYRGLVEQVAAAERRLDPHGSQLARSVARNYFKLLAYKDEYEVARMHASAEFQAQIQASFEGPVRLSFHLAPPLFARRDPRTGVPRKIRVGAWMMGVFKLLAKLKFLRCTALDPFGYTTERRAERALIRQYEEQVRRMLEGLSPARLAVAIELAQIPDMIRGFGHVKQRNQQLAASAESVLWERWQTLPSKS
jgi:indolepyruvate ferredoxin oxidoreductase